MCGLLVPIGSVQVAPHFRAQPPKGGVLPHGATIPPATGMDRSVEMAAISLGADGFTLFRRVTLPAILPGIVSGWALAFIQSFDDLTMTVFLASPGTETLPVRMFLYIQDNIDPLVTSVSASVIAITMSLLVVLDRLYGLDRVLSAKGDAGG